MGFTFHPMDGMALPEIDRCRSEGRTLSDSVVFDQHPAEPCLAWHHASVSITSLFERNRFDLRADILWDAEGKGARGIDRRASQCHVHAVRHDPITP